MKENIKALRHWPLCGNSPVTGEFPAQMASNAEKCFYLMTSSCLRRYVPDASWELAALTSSTAPVLHPIVSLVTRNQPPEDNDVYRQMCRIRAERPATVLIDFLDISHDESATPESPYCVYWPGSHTCSEKASRRQIYFVETTPTMPEFTLLFWSNNYTITTTARFWIDIRGIHSLLTPPSDAYQTKGNFCFEADSRLAPS